MPVWQDFSRWNEEEFLTCATKAGLCLYVAQTLDDLAISTQGAKPRQVLLDVAAGTFSARNVVHSMMSNLNNRRKHDLNLDVKMVQVLLSRGADPNGKMPGSLQTMTWATFLNRFEP